MVKIVLHIIWAGGTGGAERFVRDIIFHSDQSSFRHVVCFLSRGGWVADQIKGRGFEAHILGLKDTWSWFAALRLIPLLWRVCPDIIHNHDRHCFVNLLLLFFYKGPRIYFEHGGDLLSPNPGKEVFFYNFFGRKHTLVLANSQFVRNEIIRLTHVPESIIEVFYIGIDIPVRSQVLHMSLKASLGISEGYRVAGIVGRLEEMKGTDDFIRIAAAYSKIFEAVPCVFLVIGNGSLGRDLQELADEIGVNIVFLGDRSDVPDLLTIMDVFVFTSRWEPFGIAILEAMAAGIPVVGFFSHGSVEIADKGGVIAVNGRDIDKAAAEVGALLKNSVHAKALGDQGRRNVQLNFEVRGSIRRLEEIYDRVAG